MSRGAPVLAAMSLNRRTPRKSSRTTSNDHFSPTTSSAPAIEHRRGVDVRVAAVTPAAWHKEFANPTDLGYGPRNTAGWESQPTSEDHGDRRCDRDVGAQRPSYGDRRSAPRRRDRGTGAGNRDVDAAGAVVTTTVAPVVVVEDKRNTSAGAVLATLSVAAFMASLDLFIVNVAFADIARDFPGSSLGDLSWILSGYAVLYAA